MSPKTRFILILMCAFQISFSQKFEPEHGKCLVFVGQDLEAVGGLDEYSKGYTDYFKTPAGVTVYTNLSPGTKSYSHYNRGLDGIKTRDNWGAGDSCAEMYLKDPTFQNSVMVIGLSFVDHEKQVATGKHDALIKELAEWIKASNRPVFLRIGYEFDGWEWNHYKRKHYLKAWKRIHQLFSDAEVDNVAFVWQSKGNGSDQNLLEDWYPGDDLVDWVGYSYFGNPDEEMLVFARTHNKPVFIAEATPVREMDGLYFDSDLKKEDIAELIWKEWFVPFFETIKNNSDVIKAFSYINCEWMSQPMWIVTPTFQKVDARLQVSAYVSEKWKKEMKDLRYLHASEDLWKALKYK